MSVKIAIKTVFFAVLLYSMFTLPVLAAESADVGIQPYYAHPLTGVVEDVGDNPAIGQGMVESVLSPGGFYEVDNDGNQWLTLRLNLADHTKMPPLQYRPVAVADLRQFKPWRSSVVAIQWII